jgi:alkylation response protein AidB-like acyl-CoA dehydrogenase
MTDTASAPTTGGELIDELRSWLEDNWDPDLTVGDWWERLGLAGWAAPVLPTNAYGRGLSRNEAVRVQGEIAAFGALGAPAGLGVMLAAPTIAHHGTQEQVDTFVRDAVTGQRAWCQLFSEPGAGSDLAGLTCRAVADGDEWIVDGQKVWTSLGSVADLGMLIARTSPDLPKHRGISWFAIDMHQPGIEVRPLREMTGHALFSEVFLTEARVPDDARIGDRDNGWAVANTTLMHERASLGSGGGSGAAGAATPGTVAGQLGLRAGDLAPGSRTRPPSPGAGIPRASSTELVELARANGTVVDPTIRQDLVRLHILSELGRFNSLRFKAVRKAGGDIPGMGNLAKLSMSDTTRLARDLGARIVGPSAMLHAYDDDAQDVLDEATGNPRLGRVTSLVLWAQAPGIYGGTDQVQRNIIGERVLGLPKEPNDDKTRPFSELPRNG